MTPRRKRHVTYVIIGLFFLLQGVEYAVILPTLWLYIEERFHGKPYILGMVMASFSFAGLISSPLMGRWSDRTGNTKTILLVANIFQMIGSVMYFIGLNTWFLIGARFVAGFGTGVGSAMFADIARVTPTEERTAVMSMFMAIRQVGLLLGPGCNIFLRKLNFYIGPFVVDKFTAPGVFMATVWVLHEILAFFMYSNLPALKIEETLIKQQEEENTTQSSGTLSRNVVTSRIPTIESPLVQPSSSYSINSHPRSMVVSPGGRQHQETSPTAKASQYQPISGCDDERSDLTSSNVIIEQAEVLMGAALVQKPEDTAYHELPIDTAYHELPIDTSLSDPDGDSSSRANTRSSYGALSENGDLQHLYDNSYNSGFESDRTSDAEGSDATSLSSSLPTSSQQAAKHITTRFLCQEFVREEIIAILFTTFVAFFNQVGIETLFTPLSKKLLDWGELENSYLFCGAGAEVIAVFFLVRFMSRRMADRWLLVFGFLVLTATIAVATWFLPQAKPGNNTANLAGLLCVVFFDVLALPFLAVASASLYSKLTRQETQGLAQGFRRTSVGIGTILGPLWAGCMFTSLQLYFSVSLGICAIALVLLFFSFKHLDENKYQARIRRQSRRSRRSQHDQTPNGVIVRSWDDTQNEHRPLLHGDT